MALFGRKKPARQPSPGVAVVDEPLPCRTLAEQLAAVLADVEPLAPVGLPVDQALGLTLCERIVSDLDLPLVTTAQVEGYGLRRANIVGASPLHPIDLPVVGVVEQLDRVPAQAVGPGTCVLLAAGAPIPAGMDALVPVEDAALSGRTVRFTTEIGRQQNLVLRGSRLADGDELLAAGTLVDAAAAGLLAEVGLDEVLVRPKPRATILAVGPGLVPTGEPLTAIDRRYSGTAALLAACLQADGATVRRLGPVGRDAAAVRELLAEASDDAELVLVLAEDDTDAYLIGDLLEESGPVDRAHVPLNAGGPLITGRRGAARMLVLPEAAVSAFGLYHALVRPLLDRLAGRPVAGPARCELGFAGDAGCGVRVIPATLRAGRALPIEGGGELAYDLQRADGAVQVGPGRVAVGDLAPWLPLPGRP